jgi:hypothetical protein
MGFRNPTEGTAAETSQPGKQTLIFQEMGQRAVFNGVKRG